MKIEKHPCPGNIVHPVQEGKEQGKRIQESSLLHADFELIFSFKPLGRIDSTNRLS